MSIYCFLNPESEKRVTGDLTDEEIIAMVYHDISKNSPFPPIPHKAHEG